MRIFLSLKPLRSVEATRSKKSVTEIRHLTEVMRKILYEKSEVGLISSANLAKFPSSHTNAL